MSGYRQLIARMAADAEFAAYARSNLEAVAGQYSLSAVERRRLSELVDGTDHRAPRPLGARLSKSGFGAGVLGAVAETADPVTPEQPAQSAAAPPEPIRAKLPSVSREVVKPPPLPVEPAEVKPDQTPVELNPQPIPPGPEDTDSGRSQSSPGGGGGGALSDRRGPSDDAVIEASDADQPTQVTSFSLPLPPDPLGVVDKVKSGVSGLIGGSDDRPGPAAPPPAAPIPAPTEPAPPLPKSAQLPTSPFGDAVPLKPVQLPAAPFGDAAPLKAGDAPPPAPLPAPLPEPATSSTEPAPTEPEPTELESAEPVESTEEPPERSEPPEQPPAKEQADTAAADATARKLLDAALAQTDDRFEFGAEVGKDSTDPSAFDSSELVEWAASQAGADIPDGAVQQYRHLAQLGTTLSVEQAINTPGGSGRCRWPDGGTGGSVRLTRALM